MPFPAEQKHELWEAASQKQNHKIFPDPMTALQNLQWLIQQRVQVFCSTAVERDKGAIYDVNSNSQLTSEVRNEPVQQTNKPWIHTNTGVSFVQPKGERRGSWVFSTG